MRGTEEFDRSIHDPQWRRALRIYGAFDREKLVGILAARGNGEHISLFFVKSAYQRLGIGRKLFETLLQDCSPDAVTVNASPYAVPVYRRLGFAATDAEQCANGLWYTPMELRLFC